MSGQRGRNWTSELRRAAVALVLYAGLLAGIGYGVLAVATHPDFIAWLEPARALDLIQAKPPRTERPHASLPPKLRGALAE